MSYQCPGCRQSVMIQAALEQTPILRCQDCDGYLVNYKVLARNWTESNRYWPGFARMIERSQGRCHFCGVTQEAGTRTCKQCNYHLSIECPSHELMLGATIGTLKLDYCPECRDVWMDSGELVELASLNNWNIWDGTGAPPEAVAEALKRNNRFNVVHNVVDAIISPFNKFFG